MAHSGLIHFAWLDANMYNDDNKQLLKKIREINNETMEFIEEDECVRFLGRGVADPRRFVFIVSGRLGQGLVPRLHDHENILSIYVYCGDKKRNEQWSQSYNKVRHHLAYFCILCLYCQHRLRLLLHPMSFWLDFKQTEIVIETNKNLVNQVS
jgi:hypothetical protein